MLTLGTILTLIWSLSNLQSQPIDFFMISFSNSSEPFSQLYLIIHFSKRNVDVIHLLLPKANFSQMDTGTRNKPTDAILEHLAKKQMGFESLFCNDLKPIEDCYSRSKVEV